MPNRASRRRARVVEAGKPKLNLKECRSRHWRIWKTKTLIDGRWAVECPHCGVIKTQPVASSNE